MLVAAAALAVGLGAAAVAVLLVGKDGAGEPASTTAAAEPVSGRPVRLAGTDVRSGEPVRLRALAGEPVVLVVWASWCRACSKEIEALAKLVASREQAKVVTVATQDDEATARAFVEEAGLSAPTIADQDGRLAARLGVRELPTTFFLTTEHRIASVWEGPAGPGRLRAGLEIAKAG